MTLTDVLTIVAIIIGPIAAVVITEERSRSERSRERRMEVFRSLMKTRRRALDSEHIGALNLVEIEFYRDSAVLAEFKELLNFFETGIQRKDGEADERFDARYVEEHSHRLTSLLYAMGKSLGYKYEQLEILKGGYNPRAWGDIETQQQKARSLLADLYDGKKLLPLAIVDLRTPEQIIETQEAYERKLKGRGEHSQ